MAGSVIVDDPILLQAFPQQLPLKLMQHLEGTWIGEGVCEYPPHVPRVQYLQELVIEKAVPHGPRQLTWSFHTITRRQWRRTALDLATWILDPSSMSLSVLSSMELSKTS